MTTPSHEFLFSVDRRVTECIYCGIRTTWPHDGHCHRVGRDQRADRKINTRRHVRCESMVPA